MGVNKYKEIQNITERKDVLAQRIIRTIISYINEYQDGSNPENKRKEALLNAHMVCTGALTGLSTIDQNPGIITLSNVIDLTFNSITKELTTDGGDLNKCKELLEVCLL